MIRRSAVDPRPACNGGTARWSARTSTSAGRLPSSPGPAAASAATWHGRWLRAVPSSSRRSATRAADVAWTTSDGGRVEPIELDVTDVPAMRAAVDAAVLAHGRIDILVNNAGLGTNHDAVDATEAEWDELMAVNVRGLFFLCQAAGRHMLGRGRGRIIMLSSQAGSVGIRRHAAYCASKGGSTS